MTNQSTIPWLFSLLLLTTFISSAIGGVVTDPTDTGPGTLRDVLSAAMASEIITFS